MANRFKRDTDTHVGAGAHAAAGGMHGTHGTHASGAAHGASPAAGSHFASAGSSGSGAAGFGRSAHAVGATHAAHAAGRSGAHRFAEQPGAYASAEQTRVAQPLVAADAAPRAVERGRSRRGAAGGAVPPRGPQGSTRVNPYEEPNGGRRGRRGSAGGDDAGRRRKRGNLVSNLLIGLGVILLLVAGGLFLKAQLGYKEAQDSYAKVQELALTEAQGDNVPTVNFDELRKINKDVIGWIYVPGTVINYPVVQTNNNETYLHRIFDGKGNGSGTIFMDMDDKAPGMVDQQTTIYGHHMNDGSMFRTIDNTLQSQDEFDKIKYVYYITPEKTYKYVPVSTTQVQDNYGDARVANFADDAAFSAYLKTMLEQAKSKSSDAEEKIADAKQVLTLVTCAGEIIPRTTRAAMICVPVAE